MRNEEKKAFEKWWAGDRFCAESGFEAALAYAAKKQAEGKEIKLNTPNFA